MDRLDEIIFSNSNPKLYSRIGIALATFLGAPLGASILIRSNFYELGEDKKGNVALLIGIISTIVIVSGIQHAPNAILDALPELVIPLGYIIIIQVLVDKFQGRAYREFERQGMEYKSNFKAIAFGLIGTVSVMIIVFINAFIQYQQQ